MRKSETKRKILRLTDGVLGTMTDMLLAMIFGGLLMAGGGGKSMGAMFKSAEGIDKLMEEINYETIKHSFYRLKRKGLIRLMKEESWWKPQITTAGKKRLRSVLPVYEEKRPWDGRIYLVTYDVSEKQSGDRDKLRDYLRLLGAAQLQASVYLTPYNPKGSLKDFIKEKELSGSVIVSDLGPDGSVGEKSLEQLVIDLYELEWLNERYKDFLADFKKYKQGKILKHQIMFSYYAILGDDPQLPWELLPSWWLGDKAREEIKTLMKIV